MTEIDNSNGKKQKKWIWIATAIFLVLGIGFLIYWWIWGQYSETTNDTYVNGNMVEITPQVAGIVTKIYIDNTELVEEGKPLLELDPHDYEIEFEKAKAHLANVVREVAQLFLKVEELHATKQVRMAELIRTFLDYQHREALVGDGSVSVEDYEHSRTAFMGAYAAVTAIEKQHEQAVVEISGRTIATHPKVEQAKAELKKAYLFLHRCTVLAPTRGIITQRKAQVGQWVKENDPLMALIPLDQIWVDANFREVSLKNFRIGQPVEMFSDMYGRRLKFHGKLVGLNPATGSILSILPPQNATGNWIKIVQRVPVKISLDPQEILHHPLVMGLSITATVDTHQREGAQLPSILPCKVLYATPSYDEELKGVTALIEEIIQNN